MKATAITILAAMSLIQTIQLMTIASRLKHANEILTGIHERMKQTATPPGPQMRLSGNGNTHLDKSIRIS